ncbi:hypothetical protein LTR95_015682 [Oleoguttula sp. CCFEE 5521]
MDLGSSNIADCLPESVKDHVLCIRKTGSADGMVELVSSKIVVDGVDSPAQLGLAEGLLVLEASGRILTFATDVVKGIMHDIPVAKLLDYPITVIDIATIQEDIDVKSLAQSTAELPYKIPAVANIGSLISLLAAARDTAADHIHSLREDPQYYEYHVQERASYEPELIPDVLGRSVAKMEGEGSVWMKGVAVELVASHLDLERWSTLHDQAVEVHALQQKGNSINNSDVDPIPHSLSFAILRFRDLALSFAEDMTDDLLALVLRSPIMKDYVRFDVERKELTRRQGYKAGKPEEFLLEMCKSLSNRAPGCLKQGKVYPVHEFQRLVDVDEAIADIIPERVERQVSDIGLVTECLRQIELLQPLSRSFAEVATAQQGALDAEYAVFQKKCQKIEESFSVGAHNSGELGVPQGKRFLYPVDKRRTEKTVKRIRESEHNLDVHWRAVDEIVERLETNIGTTACWKDFIKPRSLARTPEWYGPSNSKPAVPEPCVPPPGSNIYDPQLAYLFENKPRDLFALATRTKEKTRGIAQPPKPRNVDVPAEPAIEPTIIEVDQRALDVFQTLFYTPDLPGKPAEIPWSELLYAMTYIGFNAKQLYGSVWHFSSLTLGKGFHFHQPHPQPRIPYRKVRRGRSVGNAPPLFLKLDEIQCADFAEHVALKDVEYAPSLDIVIACQYRDEDHARVLSSELSKLRDR